MTTEGSVGLRPFLDRAIQRAETARFSDQDSVTTVIGPSIGPCWPKIRVCPELGAKRARGEGHRRLPSDIEDARAGKPN